jgi:antitoxin component YwqK of YwqJK toxin-antitoxin module
MPITYIVMQNRFLFWFIAALLCTVVFSCKNEKKGPQERILKYVDGSIKRRYSLVDGKIEGEMLNYYPKTGAVEARRQFVAGIQVGRTELFYPDGKRKEVQYYEAGKKHGGDTIFYPSGQPQFLVSFKNGKMDGPMRRWEEDGALFFEALYANDSLIQVTKKMEALKNTPQ